MKNSKAGSGQVYLNFCAVGEHCVPKEGVREFKMEILDFTGRNTCLRKTGLAAMLVASQGCDREKRGIARL